MATHSVLLYERGYVLVEIASGAGIGEVQTVCLIGGIQFDIKTIGYVTGIARLCQKRKIVTGSQFVERCRCGADSDIVRPRIVIIATARDSVVSMPLALTVGIPSRVVQS